MSDTGDRRRTGKNTPQRREYYRKKSLGICAHPGCAKATGDRTYCFYHTDLHNQYVSAPAAARVAATRQGRLSLVARGPYSRKNRK